MNLEKFHIWVGIQASAKYPLHKWRFGTSGKMLCKNRYQSFLALSSLSLIFYFSNYILQNIILFHKYYTFQNNFSQI